MTINIKKKIYIIGSHIIINKIIINVIKKKKKLESDFKINVKLKDV
jgi:hypothetical protein